MFPSPRNEEIKLGQTRVKTRDIYVAINSMVGKVAKIVRIARAGARVHACFRLRATRGRSWEGEEERNGGGGGRRGGREDPYRPRVDLRGAPCIFTAAL